MNIELKPCPFCETELKSYEAHACNGLVVHYHPHHYSCPLSDLRISKRRLKSWNIRVDATKDAEIARLRQLLASAQRYVGMVRSYDIAGEDPIFGVMEEINAAISSAKGTGQ